MATVISALWLGTEFAPIDLLGFALIIGGCLLVSMSGEKDAQADAEDAPESSRAVVSGADTE